MKNSMLIRWVVSLGCVTAGVLLLKVAENANRIRHLGSILESYVDLNLAFRAGIVMALIAASIILADVALRRVFGKRDRLCLTAALLLFSCAIWAGVGCATERMHVRVLDAIIDYHKLMRKWEPVWAGGDNLQTTNECVGCKNVQ